VELLERKLVVGSYAGRVNGDGEDDGFWEEEGSEEEEDEEVDEEEVEAGFVGSSPAKLGALARDYVAIERLADSLGSAMPFVRKMEERILRCRNTILLDLSTALREVRKAEAQTRTLKFLAIYRLLDAEAEATRVLKEK
jgi:hypothetical protein